MSSRDGDEYTCHMAAPSTVNGKAVAEAGALTAVMSVQRALDMLSLLAGNTDGLRLTEIAAELGADRANAMRILAEMERGGFVYRDAVSDRYRLTFQLTSLGFRHLEATGVEGWVQPILDHLARATRELVRMTVVDGHGLRWVAKAQFGKGALIVDPHMGAEVILNATATGKAWLSTHSDEDAIALVLRQGIRPNTPHTLVTTKDLVADLKRVRQRGYGTAVSEGELGVLAIAAPILTRTSNGTAMAVGTVSVVGPAQRVMPETLDEWAPAVIHAAGVLGDTWGPYARRLGIGVRAESTRV